VAGAANPLEAIAREELRGPVAELVRLLIPELVREEFRVLLLGKPCP
jgi:hypothetical protein